MALELSQLISADSFRRDLPSLLAKAKAGNGPIGVTEGEQIVGVFLSIEDYEAAYGAAIRRMLQKRIRSGGPTYSTTQVLDRVKSRLRKIRKAKP